MAFPSSDTTWILPFYCICCANPDIAVSIYIFSSQPYSKQFLTIKISQLANKSMSEDTDISINKALVCFCVSCQPLMCTNRTFLIVHNKIKGKQGQNKFSFQYSKIFYSSIWRVCVWQKIYNHIECNKTKKLTWQIDAIQEQTSAMHRRIAKLEKNIFFTTAAKGWKGLKGYPLKKVLLFKINNGSDIMPCQGKKIHFIGQASSDVIVVWKGNLETLGPSIFLFNG